MNTTGWMIVAFLAVGVGIAGYLLSMSARRRRLIKRLHDLGETEERG
ncbi:MAG: CcmD family protein [Actinomycetota bacterium]